MYLWLDGVYLKAGLRRNENENASLCRHRSESGVLA